MAPKTKLTKALLTTLESIADEGLTLKEVCKQLDIDVKTWRKWEATQAHDAFVPLAVRVRAGMGSATDDMAWGVLREVAEDSEARSADRLAAATAILRLRTAHKIELTGKDGGAIDVSVDDARNRLMAGVVLPPLDEE